MTVEDPNQIPAAAGRLVVIGNFDGVHRGHQALLAEAAAEGKRRSLTPTALTFFPHPARALGRTAPPLLAALPRKLELIERVADGLETYVETFDERFAAQSASEFAERTLANKLKARVVLVGQDFRFGRGRAGDFAELTRLGAELGFEARSHAIIGDEHGRWSSTRIRAAIALGELDEAARLLGRPHMLSGTVARGDQRGRTIGFPTCNLSDVREALPPHGVYAVLVDREEPAGATASRSTPQHAKALATGVANIGVRPTVKAMGAPPLVEVHLFDLDQDLYGARLRVHLIASLRAEQRFENVDALKAQIASDAERARAALDGLSPDPSAGGAFR
jgi:riboflavin kinase/FMN adenylyltransferase